MAIDLSTPAKGIPRCIILTPEIDHSLTEMVKKNPGSNKSLIIRKILIAYFKENGIDANPKG